MAEDRFVPYIEIKKPGWLTTIQDSGRWGLQGRGVSVSGPMDSFSHRLANLLVGNSAEAAAFEVTMAGPELIFCDETWFAATGAEFPLTLNDGPIAMNVAQRAGAQSTLRFGLRRRGARGYLAIAGGLLVPPVLGSRSTHVVSHVGGLDNRPLRTGDRIEVGSEAVSVERLNRAPAFALPDGGARLRIMPGPHRDRFARETIEKLHSTRYALSAQSDRMGYRLEGEPLHWSPGVTELISGATMPGAVQVPRSGQPILLMADRATTGGYPIVAVVISADLPVAGQLAPGDWMEFAPCTREEALTALRERERSLQQSTERQQTFD